jgi:DNA-binding winged helix-turn-helix (wHTH) protein
MVCFGPFRFDITTGSLWRGAEFLPLLPKDAAILGVLVRHAGRIVTKDALLDAVWPQTYVTDTVIKNGIGQLRRVLGDDRKTPRYIETYPRRGYRFIDTVGYCWRTYFNVKRLTFLPRIFQTPLNSKKQYTE